jgi:hypothetical protein
MQDIAIGRLHVDVALGNKTAAFVVAADDYPSEVNTAVRWDGRSAASGRLGKSVRLLAQQYRFENSRQARCQKDRGADDGQRGSGLASSICQVTGSYHLLPPGYDVVAARTLSARRD